MKEYYNQLNDLIEDLESDYNTYYHDIPREEFDKIIMIDPTYKQGSNNKGEFAKWLLTLYRRGERFEDDNIKEQVAAALDDYRDIKSQLKGNNAQYKDIMRFKTAKDFIDFMQNLDLTETTELELKCKDVEGANVVTRNKDWVIYNPTTYEASKLIRGQNAVWCTGRHEDDHYFRHYTSGNGKLYIFIDSHNPDNKYQMSVKDNTVRELRDRGNTSVSVESLVVNYPTLGDLLFKTEPFKDLSAVREAEKYATPEARAAMKNIYDASTGTVIINKTNAEILMDGSGYGNDFNTIIYRAFRNCKVVDNVVTIKVIGIDPWEVDRDDCYTFLNTILGTSGSLYKATKLLRVDLSESTMTNIPEGFCSGCVNLRYCSLPTTIKTIGANAFNGCKDLRKLVLSKTIEAIGLNAFTGCDKLLLLTPHHKISCKKQDLEWFKQHLKWTDREVTELKPKITDVLEESFNKNMPSWLRDYLLNHKSDLVRTIDFTTAEVIDLSDEIVSLNARDPRLAESNMAIYLFKNNRGEDIIFIPAINYNAYTNCPWLGNWDRRMDLIRASKQKLIDNALHIAYIPDYTKYLLGSKLAARDRAKKELPFNYDRDRGAFIQREIETEVPAHYNSKDKWVNATKLREIKWVTALGFDKSGYKLTDKVDTLVNALIANKIDVDSKAFKGQLNRLDNIKEKLGKKLMTYSQEELLKPENEFIFDLIDSLRDVYSRVNSILNNIKSNLEGYKRVDPALKNSYKNSIRDSINDLFKPAGYNSIRRKVDNIINDIDTRASVILK